MKHKILCVIISVFSLLSLLSLGSCRNDPKDIARIQLPDTIAGQFITNGEIIYSELGEVKARIIAPVINNYETSKSYTEMPDGFEAEFFDKNLEVETRITAEYGIFLNGEDKMIARRNVEVHSLKEGEKMNTEELTWDMAAKKIYTDVFVKMTDKDRIFWGYGFESDENFENHIIKNFGGEILVDKEEE